MQLIVGATYKNGAFIPDQSLEQEQEGKKFKLIVIENEKIRTGKERFFRFVENYSFALPEDYRFTREEIYEGSTIGNNN